MSSYSWKKQKQCKADEQFHFANKKWDVTKNNNNKNEKQEKTKKEERYDVLPNAPALKRTHQRSSPLSRFGLAVRR